MTAVEDMAVFLLAWLEDCGRGMPSYLDHYASYVARNKNKDHFGDCTKAPITCDRCVCDEYLDLAKQVIERAALSESAS